MAAPTDRECYIFLIAVAVIMLALGGIVVFIYGYC